MAKIKKFSWNIFVAGAIALLSLGTTALFAQQNANKFTARLSPAPSISNIPAAPTAGRGANAAGGPAAAPAPGRGANAPRGGAPAAGAPTTPAPAQGRGADGGGAAPARGAAGGARGSATAGVGSATATLSGRKLTIDGKFEKLASSATTAQLFLGPVTGARGTSVFDLSISPGTSGTVTGIVDLSAEQVDALRKGRFYIQIHSQGAPNGHLLGWLLAEK